MFGQKMCCFASESSFVPSYCLVYCKVFTFKDEMKDFQLLSDSETNLAPVSVLRWKSKILHKKPFNHLPGLRPILLSALPLYSLFSLLLQFIIHTPPVETRDRLFVMSVSTDPIPAKICSIQSQQWCVLFYHQNKNQKCCKARILDLFLF